MARARKQQQTSSEGSQGEFVCPECGRSFDRAAGLGAHRSRAHGVAGSSKSAAGKRATGSSAGSRGRARRGGSTQATRARRTATAARNDDGGRGIDRDQLLRSVFPDGVPPREDVIRAVGQWLDEAERLARLK